MDGVLAYPEGAKQVGDKAHVGMGDQRLEDLMWESGYDRDLAYFSFSLVVLAFIKFDLALVAWL
jgi:hypothetical protein